MGIANILQRKLARAALDNGIKGLVAYTSPENSGMKKLFHKLQKIKREREEDMLILSCLFSDPIDRL